LFYQQVALGSFFFLKASFLGNVILLSWYLFSLAANVSVLFVILNAEILFDMETGYSDWFRIFCLCLRATGVFVFHKRTLWVGTI
jgi:hypothetical protein